MFSVSNTPYLGPYGAVEVNWSITMDNGRLSGLLVSLFLLPVAGYMSIERTIPNWTPANLPNIPLF